MPACAAFLLGTANTSDRRSQIAFFRQLLAACESEPRPATAVITRDYRRCQYRAALRHIVPPLWMFSASAVTEDCAATLAALRFGGYTKRHSDMMAAAVLCE